MLVLVPVEFVESVAVSRVLRRECALGLDGNAHRHLDAFVVHMLLHRTKVNPLPGYIGAGSLIVGIALFMAAKRKDEPDRKYRVN